MNHRSHWLVGFGAVAVIAASSALLLRSCHRPQKVASAAPVTTTSVTSGDVPIELNELGRAMALNTVTIRPQIAGQVMAIRFKDGQYVRQGDVLVEMDPRPLQATVSQDKANLARDRASLASAKANLNRYDPLLPEGVVSVQQVSDQGALVAQLEASVAAGQAALERDQVQLGYTTMSAPISGVLGLRQVDVGNVLDPASPSGVVVLTQIQPMTVIFPVPQADLAEIQERRAASGASALAVEAWSQDGTRQLDQGVLEALSNQVDATSGTVMLKALFPNAHETLWPGASVTVRLVLEVQHDGLTVPASAVNQGPSGPYVWTVKSDGTVAIAPIEIRQQLRGQVLVSSGLAPGEQVVTNGQYGLTPGVHVSVQLASGTRPGGVPLRANPPGRLGIPP